MNMFANGFSFSLSCSLLIFTKNSGLSEKKLTPYLFYQESICLLNMDTIKMKAILV